VTLLCKKIIVAKSKEVKTGSNITESSKKGYGSKSAVLMIMMMNQPLSPAFRESSDPTVSNSRIITQ
jgi:hypothetical protein